MVAHFGHFICNMRRFLSQYDEAVLFCRISLLQKRTPCVHYWFWAVFPCRLSWWMIPAFSRVMAA